MNTLNDNRRIFATVTRNGIAVLFAAWLCGGQNILKKDLEYITGLTDKPVADALRILQAENFLHHTREGWTLTRGGLQMFLAEPTRNISESINSNNSESFNTDQEIEEDQHTTINTISDSEYFRLADLSEALDNAKITDPTKSEIMRKPGLTGLHVIRLEKIKKAEVEISQLTERPLYYTPGLLIAALRALPDNPDIPHEFKIKYGCDTAALLLDDGETELPY